MQGKWHCRRDGHSCANKPPLQSERFHKKNHGGVVVLRLAINRDNRPEKRPGRENKRPRMAAVCRGIGDRF